MPKFKRPKAVDTNGARWQRQKPRVTQAVYATGHTKPEMRADLELFKDRELYERIQRSPGLLLETLVDFSPDGMINTGTERFEMLRKTKLYNQQGINFPSGYFLAGAACIYIKAVSARHEYSMMKIADVENVYCKYIILMIEDKLYAINDASLVKEFSGQ